MPKSPAKRVRFRLSHKDPARDMMIGQNPSNVVFAYEKTSQPLVGSLLFAFLFNIYFVCFQSSPMMFL